MLYNSYNSEILYGEFHWIYLQENVKLLLAVGNNRLIFEIKIVHDLLCHPILCMFAATGVLTVSVKGKYLSPAG